MDEQLVTRVVAAVLRELGHGEAAPPPETTPEFLSDPDVRKMLLPVSRSRYHELTRLPDFPVAIRIGRTNFRRVADVRAWMAARETT